MRYFLHICVATLFVSNLAIAQSSATKSSQESKIDTNGYEFLIADTDINSKYSEIGSGLFKDKVIMVSSKKIGAVGNGIDENTNEPFTNLYCVDIKENRDLERPLLFSRILNTKNSEGQITFTQDEKRVYFSRNSRENPINYQLYKAQLLDEFSGNWENIELLDVSNQNYSIETPYVIGDKIYFASNMEGGFGGFDLYVADIHEDGKLGKPKNLGEIINTDQDEKYPFVSKDNGYLYFSSKGHNNLGGYDVFASRIYNNGFKKARNLGNTLNTEQDEIAFFLTSRDLGYVTSNKNSGQGSYDIYKFEKIDIFQELTGTVTDKDTQIPLPNTLVTLTDGDGNELGRQFTDDNGNYNFTIVPFDNYTLTATKDGFYENSIVLDAEKGTRFTYTTKIELEPTKAEIVAVDDKLMISIENIYFDFDKWTIKKESTISLNKIVDVLNENPEMKIEINAHTDNKGSKRYNQVLSEKRAASAMKYLIDKGIEATRLISHGYGESQPLIDCKDRCTKAQDQENRRIEFVIIESNLQ